VTEHVPEADVVHVDRVTRPEGCSVSSKVTVAPTSGRPASSTMEAVAIASQLLVSCRRAPEVTDTWPPGGVVVDVVGGAVVLVGADEVDVDVDEEDVDDDELDGVVVEVEEVALVGGAGPAASHPLEQENDDANVSSARASMYVMAPSETTARSAANSTYSTSVAPVASCSRRFR